MTLPVLDAGPCRLRSLREDDAEAWLAIITEPELRRLTSWSIDSLDSVRALLAGITTGARAATTRRWAIERDGRFIGTCGFKNWDQDLGTAEVAYELAAEHRGQGLMGTVLERVLSYGRVDLELSSAHAVVMVDNVASQRVLERARFLRTERLTAFRACSGVLRDFHRYERRLV